MNHMIHNLTPTPDEVYITYDLDFVPDERARGGRHERGRDGLARRWAAAPTRCSTPSAAPAARTSGSRTRTRSRRRRGGTAGRCRWTARSSAPRGTCTRAGCGPTSRSRATGETTRLFRSKAKYYEPAGAVSWDVSMTVTPPTGASRCARATCSASRAPTTPRGVVVRVDGDHAGDVRPRRDRRRPVRDRRRRRGRGHARAPARERQPRRRPALRPARPARPARAPGRRRRQGRDPGLRLRPGRPQHDRQGGPPGARAPRPRAHVRQPRRRGTIFHTITACKAPCNRTTGIAYPLADGKVDFDSGELGFGPRGLHGGGEPRHVDDAEGLEAGTYTYFCRVHPFMRGAFKVKPRR